MTQNRKTKSIIILLGMSLMVTACSNKPEKGEAAKPAIEQESQITQTPEVSEAVDNNADSSKEETDTTKNQEESSKQGTESVLSPEVEKLFNEYMNLERGYEDYMTASQELIDTLKSAKTESSMADQFAGTWERTDCWSSLGGELHLTEMSKDGFKVDGCFYYYSHSGALETGEGYFISDTKAVAEVTSFDGEQICLILFDFSDGLKVVGINGEGFGFGASVSLDGTYTQDSPVYTNANALEENFTQEEQQKIKALFVEHEVNYDDRFLFPVQFGGGEKAVSNAVFADGSNKKGTWYSYFVPTMGGYEFELFITEDGMIYWQGTELFLSNDDNAQNMPQKGE